MSKMYGDYRLLINIIFSFLLMFTVHIELVLIRIIIFSNLSDISL